MADGQGEKDHIIIGPFVPSALTSVLFIFFQIKCKKLIRHVLKSMPEQNRQCVEGVAGMMWEEVRKRSWKVRGHAQESEFHPKRHREP